MIFLADQILLLKQMMIMAQIIITNNLTRHYQPNINSINFMKKIYLKTEQDPQKRAIRTET